MNIDQLYEQAVSAEADRLGRMTPCELMRIESGTFKVTIESADIELGYAVRDLGDVRHIGVIADRPVLFGLAERRFCAGLIVQLSLRRMSEADAAGF